MRIEHFAPEMIVPEDQDLEHKVIHNEVIRHEDVQKYADFIINHLKIFEKASEQEKTAFIIDALNNDNLVQEVRGDMEAGLLDEREVLDVTSRVRKALVEELKGKIDSDIYLLIEDIKNATESPDPNRKNIVSLLIDKYGQQRVYKEQEIPEKYKQDLKDAVLLFQQLDPHPNIAQNIKYDEKQHSLIYEKLDFISLAQYLEDGKKSSRDKFLTGLQVLRDCVRGANYLAEHGLVLQDIDPFNLGVQETDSGAKKGVLFDLLWLVKKGVHMDFRMSKPGYFSRIMYDSDQPDPDCLSPYEMVYQFGLCLDKIKETYCDSTFAKRKSSQVDAFDLDSQEVKMVTRDIRNLSTDMQALRSNKVGRYKRRIDLKEAEERLNKIIAETEKVFNSVPFPV
ncbi:MAG: hypothetical protein HYT15_01955 [Candidatus Magasanikbacteria bacterium]|nr:hypothetical protein [Candidatus Magasanikbacteria bacterium]